MKPKEIFYIDFEEILQINVNRQCGHERDARASVGEFCREKQVPIPLGILTKSYNFKENHFSNNVKFLRGIKKILKNYSFENGKPLTFESSQEDVAILRHHYLHWNATYGDPHESVGTWLSGKNAPNMDENDKRTRHKR